MAVNEVNQITEIILEVWRRGARMVALPRKYAVLVWPKHKIEDLAEQLKAIKPELIRRLKKPKGWPRYEPFPPDWWDRVCLGFNIPKAKLSECPACGYVVAGYVIDRTGGRWFCLKCGKPADPPHRGRKAKGQKDDPETDLQRERSAEDIRQ